MAASVILEKVSEDETQVTYRYGSDLSDQGTIQLDLAAQRYVDVQAPESTSAVTEFSGTMTAISRARNQGRGHPDRLTHRSG